MKLFVCADIEGCCGITDWSETQPGSPQSEAFRKQMTEEVAAVCRGALEAGFDRVVVRDAHDSARNLLPELLPEQTRIYRGWTGDPYGMLSGLDGSFAGVVFTGFHSPARTGGSPLAHTMDTGLYEVRLNGRIASEFLAQRLRGRAHRRAGFDADGRLRHLLRCRKGASHAADGLHAGGERRRDAVAAPGARRSRSSSAWPRRF